MDTGEWSTIRLLTTASRLWEHRLNQRLTKIDITHTGLSTLRVLQAIGPSTQNSLAAALHVQTVGKVLDKLERDAKVTRVRGQIDRRVLVADLTAKGHSILQRALEIERLPQPGPMPPAAGHSDTPHTFTAIHEADFRAALMTVIRQLDCTEMRSSHRLPNAG